MCEHCCSSQHIKRQCSLHIAAQASTLSQAKQMLLSCRAYLEVMMDRVFVPSTEFLAVKLQSAVASGKAVNMEECFSQLTLDIIGKALFNYDFNSLTQASPVIQAVYTALKETEQRATDLLPYWKVCPNIHLARTVLPCRRQGRRLGNTLAGCLTWKDLQQGSYKTGPSE
jgi:hypothetical protein